MRIKNLTAESKELVVREIVGEHREYTLFVQPHSVTELDRLEVVNLHSGEFSKSFEIVGAEDSAVPVVEVAPASDSIKEETPVDTVVEPTVSEESKVEDTKSSAHICEICGAEFASARALNSHKNKAHADE